ncbi:Uncharacterized protein GBIM_18076 [Gryllus bimaculatus]|nr:Uncharacterized protein GBIM_18076 [Gryllus bimaculatus]
MPSSTPNSLYGSEYESKGNTHMAMVFTDKVQLRIAIKNTKCRKGIAPKECLAFTLRFLAIGDSFPSIDLVLKVSPQVVANTVAEVCSAIINVLQNYIKIHIGTGGAVLSTSDGAVLRNMMMFNKIQNNELNCSQEEPLLGILKWLKRKYIPYKVLSHNASSDINNSKGQEICMSNYWILCTQVLVGPDIDIQAITVRYPGSFHDARIFQLSGLSIPLEEGCIRCVILGDSGYPCETYLLTPMLNPTTLSE